MEKTKCQNKRINDWCNNEYLRYVQMRTGTNPNKYDGEQLWMCKECRKANNGEFKFVFDNDPDPDPTDDAYQPFGPEWEKEMMRLPKKRLVTMLQEASIKNANS